MRFPEFTGKWEVKKLGEILKVGSGRDYKHLKEGNIPVFGTGGYMTSVNEFLFDGESVCIGRKGTINKPFYYNGKFWTVDTLFYTYSYKNILPRFIFNVFEQINWLQYNEASGVPSLSKSTIEQIEIFIPDISEQAKIASFLSLIDERIAAQSKIIEGLKKLKASLSKQIFSRKLRFKDKNENDFPEWEERELEYTVSQFIVPMRDKPQDLTGDIPWCRIEDFNGKHLYTSKSGQGVDISTVKEMNLKIYPIDTLLVSCSANLGVCAITKKELVTNQTFIGLVTDKAKIDVEYLYYTMTLSSIKLNTLSSGTTISYLSREEFEKFKIPYPCLHEQKKIANFLSNIDNKIQVETKTFELQKRQKEYLLGLMFI